MADPVAPLANQAEEQSSRAERIEALLQQIADLPDARSRAQMEELIQSLLDLFGDGLACMLALTAQSAAGAELLSAFASDELVGSLLLLYDLHPDDIETRVARAVESLRGVVERQGARVALLGVSQGVARVQLSSGGAGCAGCAAPLSALQPLLEQALYGAAPDLEGIRIEDPSAQPQLITLTRRAPPPPNPLPPRGGRGGTGRLVRADEFPMEQGI